MFFSFSGLLRLFWVVPQRKVRGGGGLGAGGLLQRLRRGLESASEMAFSFLLFEIIEIPKAQLIAEFMIRLG